MNTNVRELSPNYFEPLPAKPTNEQLAEAGLHRVPALAAALEGLKTRFGLDGAKVVHPGSTPDVTVADVFGKPRVVHVNPNPAVITDRLIASGYNGVDAHVENYTPVNGKYDVLVALDAGGAPTADTLSRLLQPDATIIADNRTRWAEKLASLPGVTLRGAVFPNIESGAYIPASDLPTDAAAVARRDYFNGALDNFVAEPAPGVEALPQQPHYPDALFVFHVAGAVALNPA